jgi:hypothetical protein
MRWLWLQKTYSGRPWAGFPIQVTSKARAFFSKVLISEVGNGSNTLFWTDNWLQGRSISTLAPRLFSIIPKRITKRRTVQEALLNRNWIADIKGAGFLCFYKDILVQVTEKVWVAQFDP